MPKEAQAARWAHLSDDHYRQRLINNSAPDKSGCRVWTAALTQSGYGAIRYYNRQWRAHRLSFHLFIAPITSKFVVMHTCDNPRCISPQHLRIGTPAENTADMVQKKRQHHKLTDEQVRMIRNDDRSTRTIAKEFKVSAGHVWCLQNGARRNGV